MELLPAKATFAPGEPIEVEVRDAASVGTVVALTHLDHQVAEAEVGQDGVVRFPAQPEGGYGVESEGAASALDVLADPLERPRYGFVCDFAAARDPAGVVENIRRLHLNAIQFYDWMYRHAQLLPPSEEDEYDDALGRRLSLVTVRRMAQAVREAGSLPFGYAAVYAVGRDEWPAWQDEGLYYPDGTPWTLGDDFLWIVDPSSERWLAHFTADLRAARTAVGFSGFHLDQYGAPKRALRRDGSEVDLAQTFPELVERVARDVPGRRIFNNVNDFPTWTTAGAEQDAVYIEAWSPHDRYANLAELVTKARAIAPDKAVILAAYLSAYTGDEEAARAAERLELATVCAHGGTVLLHGEENAALTEGYYVSHARLGPESIASTRRSYDFLVRYGDLLFDRTAVDVTRTEFGGPDEELVIEADVPVTADLQAGALWVRAMRGAHGLVINLIDFTPQTDDRWNAGKVPGRPLAGVQVAVARVPADPPAFFFAEPDDSPGMRRLDSSADGRHDRVEIPPFRSWAILWVNER